MYVHSCIRIYLYMDTSVMHVSRVDRLDTNVMHVSRVDRLDTNVMHVSRVNRLDTNVMHMSCVDRLMGVTESNFSNLPQLLVLTNLSGLLPLAFLGLLPEQVNCAFFTRIQVIRCVCVVCCCSTHCYETLCV